MISPLLLNIAMQGMEKAAGARYDKNCHAKPGTPAVVTYADDFVALCHSREQAEAVREKLSTWLKPRGLSFNQDKTRIVHIDDGFDFLSFNIRRYYGASGTKVLTKPSKDALRKIRRRLRQELRDLRGATTEAVIRRLNPIIRGQASYHRTGVSTRAYAALDHHLWRHLYTWGLHRHRNKGRKWVTARYFGTFNKTRNDTWVFGDRTSGAYLHKYAWTKIVGMSWSPAGHPPMTPPSPGTGPTAGASSPPPSWPTPGTRRSAPRPGPAPCAATSYSTPAARTPPARRKPGTQPCARH